MESAERKTEKLNAIITLLADYPWGYTRAQMSRKIGVSKATIGRYITELMAAYPLHEEDGKIILDKTKGLSNLRLSLHEIMALYLSSVLMVQLLDKKNFHAATALRKLSTAMQAFGQEELKNKKRENPMSRQIQLEAQQIDGPDRIVDKDFLLVLENLTVSWANGKKVAITYHSRNRHCDTEYLLEIYSILPYASGHTLHVVGRCEKEEQIRVFRVDLIKKAVLQQQEYTVPPDFSVHEYFRDTWGIWKSPDTRVEVVLRFDNKAAERVRDTVWHVNQKIEEQDDGKLLWSLVIDEPIEMLPWIRSWGAGVEVLSPAKLRAMMEEEAVTLANLYKK